MARAGPAGSVLHHRRRRWRGGKPTRTCQSQACIRNGDVAASACPRDVARANLSRRHDSRRTPLSPGVIELNVLQSHRIVTVPSKSVLFRSNLGAFSCLLEAWVYL